MTDDRFGIFHLPPGLDFAQHFALGLIRRYAGHPPEALARTTVYLNSERMRRRVTEALTATGARFLPRLNLVTDLDHDPILADLPAPEPRLRRLLMLGQLVQGLLSRDESLAPRSAAYDLAASLAELIDEMQAEGVCPATIADLPMDRHAAYWLRTQAFLSIITPFFAEGGATDPAARQRLAADRLAARWAITPPPGPVIVAGSTGSRGPTFALMRAVAGLAQGALVLPGFDPTMPDAVWTAMKDALTAEDHPQFRIRRLIETLGLSPPDVAAWHDVPAPDPSRNAVLSLSLRPAPVTDQWLTEGQRLTDLPGALCRVTLVQAETPQEEAATLALILRDSAEQGLATALITPDRALGRRVTAALSLWGIVPDDAAGKPLALSAPGRFLRHIARMMTERLTSDALLILLKHPICHTGAQRGTHLRLTRELELSLRAKGPAFPTADSLALWASTQKDPFANAWAAALGRCLNALALPPHSPLAEAQAHHLHLAEAFARGTAPESTGELWLQEAGQNARALFATLAEEAAHGAPVTPFEYQRLFETLIHQIGKDGRETVVAHPLITILGPREARETGAARVILAGLNEGVWPRQSAPDPWMNRRMRHDAGLLLPERQIGLSAHDYQQAAGAAEVILSRARRDADAETVPSRWLNRLTNLLGGLPDQGGTIAMAQMIARGDDWRALAARVAEPTDAHRANPSLARAPRPAPRPPVHVRPQRLSLTRIRDLIRDPYAIYARSVLNLSKLDPLHASPDARDRGIVLHRVMETFVRDTPPGEAADETPDQAQSRLLALTETALTASVDFPTERLLWYARMATVAERIVAAEAERIGHWQALEASGEMAFSDPDFTLYGRLDRADLLPDGRLELIDYKTGTPPSKKEQEAFEKQLLLSALMAENGAFADLGPAEVARTLYVGLKAPEASEAMEITSELLSEVYGKFHHLIGQYAKRSTGYISRRALQRDKESRDYDHLARFGEWQMSDVAQRVDIGGDDDPA